MPLRRLSNFQLLALMVCGPGLVGCVPEPDDAIENWREGVAEIDVRQPITAQITSIAERAISHEVIEGLQFALVEDGSILATSAFGVADRESGRLMTTDTPINIASISKSLTAWGIVVLAEREAIDLNASIRNEIGNIELYTAIFSDVDVSARMLLSHTSGLSGPSVPVTPLSEPVPELTEILLGRSSVDRPKIESLPGSTFSYSGAGYLVLQKAIEDKTRLKFNAYMTDAVLGPAQMFDSTFSPGEKSIDQVAVYYRSDGRRRESYHLPGAAGGLYSTANDMARFITLYFNSSSEMRKSIISDAGFVALLSPVAESIDGWEEIENLQYALGHYSYETREGVKIVFHAGGNPGLRSLMLVAPDHGNGFFAVANNDRGAEVISEMVTSWGRAYGLTIVTHF